MNYKKFVTSFLGTFLIIFGLFGLLWNKFFQFGIVSDIIYLISISLGLYSWMIWAKLKENK